MLIPIIIYLSFLFINIYYKKISNIYIYIYIYILYELSLTLHDNKLQNLRLSSIEFHY
jgi:hypothetical protein